MLQGEIFLPSRASTQALQEQHQAVAGDALLSVDSLNHSLFRLIHALALIPRLILGVVALCCHCVFVGSAKTRALPDSAAQEFDDDSDGCGEYGLCDVGLPDCGDAPYDLPLYDCSDGDCQEGIADCGVSNQECKAWSHCLRL